MAAVTNRYSAFLGSDIVDVFLSRCISSLCRAFNLHLSAGSLFPQSSLFSTSGIGVISDHVKFRVTHLVLSDITTFTPELRSHCLQFYLIALWEM